MDMDNSVGASSAPPDAVVEEKPILPELAEHDADFEESLFQLVSDGPDFLSVQRCPLNRDSDSDMSSDVEFEINCRA